MVRDGAGMGKTHPAAAIHRKQSMMVVPIDAPGITVTRNLPVFGYRDREGHAEIDFRDDPAHYALSDDFFGVFQDHGRLFGPPHRAVR